MAIFARLAGTRPDPTLMGRVLPGPIKNRVGFGLNPPPPEASPGRVRVLSKNLRPGPVKNPVP